jgi:uncharacterized low-complexity protein
MGALLGGPAIPLSFVGPKWGTDIKLNNKDSSAFWASNPGSCSEAPCGAAEQNPEEQRAGETPMIGEEQPSIRGG